MISKLKFHELADEWERMEKTADKAKRCLSDTELTRVGEIEKLMEEFHDYNNRPEQQREQPGWGASLEPAKAGTPAPVGGRFAKGAKYADLFPDIQPTLEDWRSAGEFLQAIGLHRGDPRLTRRGYVENVPSDGGFATPLEVERTIFDVALEGEVVRPRARNVGMISNQKEFPATTIGDHSENVYGGVTTYWKNEATELEESQAELRKMTLTCNKLTALAYASAEWLEDAVEGQALVERTFAGALGFELDYQFLRGDGAGKPLGIENASCLITQDKESAQASSTIVADNLFNMLSRLHAASFDNSVWVAHPGCLAQLAQISIAIGTGGSLAPGALTSSNGRYSLLGKPLLFSEKMASLGSKFDLLLADFSQYIVGLRQGMRFDASSHIKFTSDQIAFRMLTRIDGQPLWDEALTLKDGSTTVSPFVTLQERS